MQKCKKTRIGRLAVLLLIGSIGFQDGGMFAASCLIDVAQCRSIQAELPAQAMPSDLTLILGAFSAADRFTWLPSSDRGMPGLPEEAKEQRLAFDSVDDVKECIVTLVPDVPNSLRSLQRERTCDHSFSATDLLHTLHRLRL